MLPLGPPDWSLRVSKDQPGNNHTPLSACGAGAGNFHRDGRNERNA